MAAGSVGKVWAGLEVGVGLNGKEEGLGLNGMGRGAKVYKLYKTGMGLACCY